MGTAVSRTAGLNPLKQVKSFGLAKNKAVEKKMDVQGLNPLKQVKSFGPPTLLQLEAFSSGSLNPLKQVKSFGQGAL